MTKTKKSLITASSVIAIIGASFCILLGIILLMSRMYINLDMVREILLEDPSIVYTEEEISLIANLSKTVLTIGSVLSLGLGIATLIVAIKVLKNSNLPTTKVGSIIALLVLSILNLNLISTGLLIAVLCIKDKRVETQTVENEIQIEK